MKKEMDRSDKMLFALLAASLKGKFLDHQENLFLEASDEDWKICRKAAVYHGVMALAWDGALLLPEDRQMPHALKLAWGLAVQEYEHRYEYYCQTAQHLSDFYAAHQVGMMQMKGVGFSTYYPKPCHREGGDIDIWTYSLDPSKMTDQEANDLADDLMEQSGIPVNRSYAKHFTFDYQGIHIENHKHFLNRSFPLSIQVDDLLYKLARPHDVELAGGKFKEKTASLEFYTLFLAFHNFQHYGSGFALHHVMDWAVLLDNAGLELPEEVQDPYLKRFVGTLTLLTNRYLGTEVPVEGDEELLERMVMELLHPVYDQHTPKMSRPKLFLYKTRRLFYRLKQQKDLMGTSILKGIWTSFMAHLKAPDSIFATN